MNELQLQAGAYRTTGELAKIESFRRQLAIVETIEEIKIIGNATEAYQQLMIKQKVAKESIDEIGEFDIEVKEKEADWLNEFYPSRVKGNAKKLSGTKREPDMPVTKKESAMVRRLKKLKKEKPKRVEAAKDKIKNSKKPLNAKTLENELKKEEKEEQIAKETERRKQEQEEQKKATPIIYNEDCTDFLKRFGNKSVDLLFTDPPYSTDIENLHEFLDTWLYISLDKIKDTGRAFICIGAYPIEVHTYLTYLLDTDWIIDCPLIWTYRNTLGQTPKMKYNLNYQMILHLYKDTSTPLNNNITNEMFSVQDINAPDGRLGDRIYKWQKPTKLAERLILHSTKTGDKIIDPFTGVGTFIISASKNNRLAWGCENDKIVCETAIKQGCKYGQTVD